MARLLRAATGVEGLDGQAARDRVRDQFRTQTLRTCCCFDDLLGIADPNYRRTGDRSRCPSAAVGRAVERGLIGPRKPGGLRR